MCGLVGVISTTKDSLNANDKDAFKLLLKLNTVRGRDSVGVIEKDFDGGFDVKKSLGTAWDFLDNSRCNKIFSKFDSFHTAGTKSKGAQGLLGHNRAATVGKVNISNAHPFTFDDEFSGMHNGTLRSYFDLEGYSDFTTDSECLLYNIYKNGFKETIEKVIGAYALVFVDEGEVYITRNDERPLYYCYIKNLFLYASEDWMLKVILSKFYPEYKADIKSLPTLTLFKVGKKLIEICKYVEKEPVVYMLGRSSSKQHSGGFKGFKGESLTYAEWKEATKLGCYFCGAASSPIYAHKYEWIDDNDYYCDHCKLTLM